MYFKIDGKPKKMYLINSTQVVWSNKNRRSGARLPMLVRIDVLVFCSTHMVQLRAFQLKINLHLLYFNVHGGNYSVSTVTNVDGLSDDGLRTSLMVRGRY